ncbi:class I SAM-dependent methyltransferase [Methylobacterium sp. CM6257]
MGDPEREIEAIKERYSRRDDGERYSLKRPEMIKIVDERKRAVKYYLARRGWHDLSKLRLVEIGCGEGNVLSELLTFGFSPERLVGIELNRDYIVRARRKLPETIGLITGDARTAPIEPSSQDIVLQFTVFSSIADNDFQKDLASAMWRWLKPSGAVLWYDLTVNNPYNPDVRGVPLKQIHSLFPSGRVAFKRITLAPPLARAVCWLHPSVYSMLNSIPALRTHALAWIEKPSL